MAGVTALRVGCFESGGTEWSAAWGGRQNREVRALMIQQFSQHQRYRGLAAATIRRRRETLEQLARFLEPLTLERATQQHLEDFLGAKHAARTKHAYRSDLRVFYAWAVNHDLIAESPAHRLDSIRVPKSLPRPIDPDYAKACLLFGERSVRRMIALAFCAGLRTFEIARLDSADVWSHTKPPVVVVRNGKGGKDRSVPMHPILHELLVDLPASGPVFPGTRGQPIRTDSVARAMTRHMQACGIEGTPHQLRHTFGTSFARACGGDMVLTAEMMGHESMDTTIGYVRLTRAGGEDVIGRMYQEDVA